MDALQQAAMQGLRPVMEAAPTEEPAPSADEMLRHVGCARMRAAMLDQMARERAWAEAEQSSFAGAVSGRSAAVSATAAGAGAATAFDSLSVAQGDDDDGYEDDDEYYYEYYEDYGTSQRQQGMVASMIAGSVGHMLRGAFADAADAQAAQLQQLHQGAALQQLQLQLQQQQAVGREELEDLIASRAALRIAAALSAGGGVARQGYDDGEEAELAVRGSDSKAAARSARDFLTSLYEYDDEAAEDEEDDDEEEEDDYGEVVGMAETMLSNLEALLSDDDGAEEEAEEGEVAQQKPATSKGEFLRQQQSKKKQAAARAGSAGSASDLDDSDEAWEDYLEQYYAYYSIYGEDEEDIYESYYESYLDPYAEAPDALDMLASLAELIAWSSHTGSLVLHLFPIGGIISGGGSAALLAQQQQQQQLSPAQLQLMQLQHLREQSDAAEVAGGRAALLFPGQPYDPATVDPLVAFYGRGEDESSSAGTIIISDLNLAWINPDGSLNWGLVTLLILTAGTLAMLVGFVVSWLSLRRTMRTAAVYPGGAAAWRAAGARRAAAKAGGCTDGSECDSLDNPLLLLPEDCYGAEPLKIECASSYVPPVLPNESVAKVLCK
ncbi:hypothetical protein HXX76_000752 [Chlamydomonas incerta]|uniref:Uncharacterized protein n=1 Tax=Chlamydomonas incerta TaxID=51695 RepID=A0A835WEV1_CHLIN|nr:hypothetical protein HXX76_000752 [Chlamydomonas incerta]|eukprot:KAG2446157.1 hypothetical protein HXX76_000752 [Chlamydomonas incerta]